MPYMKFLFVRPGFCLRLPSDSTSRWTPLPLANASYCQGAFGTFTLELSPMPGTPKKSHLRVALVFKPIGLYSFAVLKANGLKHVNAAMSSIFCFSFAQVTSGLKGPIVDQSRPSDRRSPSQPQKERSNYRKLIFPVKELIRNSASPMPFSALPPTVQ